MAVEDVRQRRTRQRREREAAVAPKLHGLNHLFETALALRSNRLDCEHNPVPTSRLPLCFLSVEPGPWHHRVFWGENHMKPLAVLIIHGVEIQDENFHLTPKRLLEKHFARQFKDQVNAPDPEKALVIEPVHWAPILEDAQRRLFEKHFKDKKGGFFEELRRLVMRV